MRIIVILVFAAGLALAALAVQLARGQFGAFEAERNALLARQADMPPLADVVVVSRALKYGERFTAKDLAIAKVQADRVPEGAFRTITGAQDAADTVFAEGETRPRATRRSYAPNEALLAPKVTAPGVDAGILAALNPNMRAFTIQADLTSGVSGFLRPGDRVDVYWSGSISDQPVTKLIDTNLRLIAVDQNADAERSADAVAVRTVTVEVSPEQVAELTLAQSTGRLNLSLVGLDDTSEIGAIEVNRNDLLGIQPVRAAAPAAPARVCTIRTRKGGDVIETQIPCTN
ncbi:Flp pilus assembly protein CpaB [Paenirhodobacter sp.]|uniref:Flp pilus assembly protein CpaB n=1 Tax=Paenirhodobacter sp. TaxID=1965326 RepID=UPI003B50C595